MYDWRGIRDEYRVWVLSRRRGKCMICGRKIELGEICVRLYQAKGGYRHICRECSISNEHVMSGVDKPELLIGG